MKTTDNALTYAWAREYDERMNDHGLTVEQRDKGGVEVNRLTGTLRYSRHQEMYAMKFVVDGQTRERSVHSGNYTDIERTGTCVTVADPFAGKQRKF